MFNQMCCSHVYVLNFLVSVVTYFYLPFLIGTFYIVAFCASFVHCRLYSFLLSSVEKLLKFFTVLSQFLIVLHFV